MEKTEVHRHKKGEIELECPQLPPFGDDAYIDELSMRKKPLSPKVIEMMVKARDVDPFSRRVIDFIAFGLRLQDIAPTDFMVVIDDVQDIDWSRYEFLGRQPPLPTGSGRGRHQGRLIFCATEPGLRITTHRLVKSSKEPVYIFVDGPGTLALTARARRLPTGGRSAVASAGSGRMVGLTALSERRMGEVGRRRARRSRHDGAAELTSRLRHRRAADGRMVTAEQTIRSIALDRGG